MTFFTKLPITLTLEFNTFFGRNRRFAAVGIDLINELIAVILALIQNTAVYDFDMLQDRNRIVDLITLSFTDHYVNGVAICIYGSVYLCTGTAVAVSNFVRESRFFRYLRCTGVLG